MVARTRPGLRMAAGLLALAVAPASHAMLIDAFAKAREHAPDYLAILADQDVSREELNLSRSQLLPQVNASASQGVADSKITSPGPGGTRLTTSPHYDISLWALQLRQPLLRPSAIYAYRSSARHVASTEALRQDARQDLLSQLIETLSQLHLANAGLDAARVAADSASQMLSLNTRLLRAGTVTRRDISAAQTDLARARQQVAEAKLAQATAIATWEALTGDSTVDLQALPADLAERLPTPGMDMNELLARAEERQPALRAAREEREADRLDIRRAQSDHLPTVDLVASRSYNASNTENTIGNTYLTNRVDLQLSVPLFSGGATQARVRQSEARFRQAEARLQSVRTKTRIQLATALAGLAQARLQAASSRAATEAAELNLRSAILGMDAGTATLADKVNAEAARAVAMRDQVRANAEGLVHWSSMQRALGELDDEHLPALVSLLGWQEPSPRAVSLNH